MQEVKQEAVDTEIIEDSNSDSEEENKFWT